MSTSSISSVYNFREREKPAESENKGKAKSKRSPFAKYRIVLTPRKTSSITGVHNCSEVNMDNTNMKVTARFSFTISRLAMAYAWNCKTVRGGTHYNGARSHCGHCQAAHAALSPTLYDNQLELIVEKIKEKGYQYLEGQDQQYLEKRFSLSEEEIIQLSAPESHDRLQYIEYLSSRLTVQELEGTYVNTFFEMVRNSTFQNPTASNRIDCHLESYLRAFEDELADRCRTNPDFTVKDALREFHQKYLHLLIPLKEKLLADEKRLCSLREKWNSLIDRQVNVINKLKSVGLIVDPQKEVSDSLDDLSECFLEIDIRDTDELLQEPEIRKSFFSYLKSVEAYLEFYKSRFDNAGQGVPRLDEFKRKLLGLQPKNFLFGMIKTWAAESLKSQKTFMLHQSCFSVTEKLEVEFQEVIEAAKKGLQPEFVRQEFLTISQLDKTNEKRLCSLKEKWDCLIDCQIKLVDKLKLSGLIVEGKKECSGGLEENSEFSLEIKTQDPDELLQTPEIRKSFFSYFQSVEAYLKTYKLCFKHVVQDGSKLDGFRQKLLEFQPEKFLREMIKAWAAGLLESQKTFMLHQSFLSITEKLEVEFQEAIEEVKKRLQEVTAQLEFVGQDFATIHQLHKMEFGKIDEKGGFVTPTKQDYIENLNANIIPAKSGVNRKYKRRRLEFDSAKSSAFPV